MLAHETARCIKILPNLWTMTLLVNAVIRRNDHVLVAQTSKFFVRRLVLSGLLPCEGAFFLASVVLCDFMKFHCALLQLVHAFVIELWQLLHLSALVTQLLDPVSVKVTSSWVTNLLLHSLVG